MTSKIQYYDVLQTYTGPNSQMRYLQQLSQPVVEDVSKYQMAIDRFRIPMTNVPIFIYNPETNFYTVELVYNGVGSGPISLIYQPPALLPTTSAYYYYVYSYNVMLSMINEALTRAFSILGGLVTLPTGSVAPYFRNDASIISLIAQVDFYNEALTTPIHIYMNSNLQKFVNGIPSSYNPAILNGRNILFKVCDFKNNTISASPSNLYVMASEYGAQTLINWNEAQGFVITSDFLPVNPEFLPIVGNQSILNTRTIISNFDFINTSDMTKGFVAQYILQSPYKTLDLIGNRPLTTIDLTVYWYDNNNNFHDLYLRQGEAISLRLAFIPKMKF
jgi:hypothetical protein